MRRRTFHGLSPQRKRNRDITIPTPTPFNGGTTTLFSRGVYFAGFEEPVQEKTSQLKATRRNQVLVQVHAVGLNPVDAKHVIGDKLQYHWTRARRWAHNLLVKNTCVGFDFAGIVVKDHPKFPSGTRVFGTMPPLRGSCNEYINVPIHQLARASNELSMEENAALPLVGLTAWQALSPHVVRGHSAVLIIGGSGGTGHIALQVAKALGAQRIVTICSTKNIEFVKQCGATHVVDYTESNDIIQDLQSAAPFDVILDCVTSADPLDAKLEYPLRVRTSPGSVVTDHLYQRLGGNWTDWIRAGFARLNIFPHSWLWKDPRERLFWIRFPNSSHELEELCRLADTGQLKPRIQKVYSGLTAGSVQYAFDDILSRRVQGKVVVKASVLGE